MSVLMHVQLGVAGPKEPGLSAMKYLDVGRLEDWGGNPSSFKLACPFRALADPNTYKNSKQAANGA